MSRLRKASRLWRDEAALQAASRALLSQDVPYFTIEPDAIFGRRAPLEIEIGAGKGDFILEYASANPEKNFLAIELSGTIGQLLVNPQLYESLARLYKEKYQDHARAAEFFAKAAAIPGAPSYDKRFSAYELSYCEGREREAYQRLRQLYAAGENERLPTLIARLKFLENKLNIAQDQRTRETEPLNR